MNQETSPVSKPADRRSAAGSPGLWLWRWVVGLLAVFTVFFQLGGRGLNEPDEGRYAEAGREMMASGDYLTPTLNGHTHLTKPPLTYWLIGVSLKSFGVNEFAARLPAALAALGTLLAVYHLGRRAMGEAGALWSVVVLLTSLLFFVVARLITTDMLLTCWVTWSVWAIWRWSEDGSWWRGGLWFFVFLGLGLITKGPVAILLSLFAVAGLRWGDANLRLRRFPWGWGILAMLAVALPWFVAVTWGKPELWGYFLGHETMQRVLTKVHGRSEPWWYFLPVIVGGLLPWSPWLVLSTRLRGTWHAKDLKLVRMCCVWAGAGLLLFTLSQSKLATYVLPLMPALALLVGLTLRRLADHGLAVRWRRFILGCTLGSLLILLGAAVAVLIILPIRYHVAYGLAGIPLVATVGVLVMVTLGGRIWPHERWPATVAATTMALVLSFVALLPRMERALGGKTPPKYLAQSINEFDPERQSPVLVFGKLHYGLLFYLQRSVLWYQPPPDDEAGPTFSGMNTSRNLVETPEELRRLLDGSDRVICVADRNAAAGICQEFGLAEAHPSGDDRHVLLMAERFVNPPGSGRSDAQPGLRSLSGL